MTERAKPLPPLQGIKLVVATFSVALATFMFVLDSSIANVAIPTIAGSMGVSIDEGTWVITLFAAANAISIPLTGWLTQRFGQVRLFVWSIFLFVLASFCCGFAPNLTTLLLARIIQGLVAGPLIPLSQAILLSSYPKEKSSFALALWGMTATVGPIAGPALGGWITDNYSWSWIFNINIPVGLLAASMTWYIYKDRDSAKVNLPIDGVGLALLVVWVGALQIMLDKGKDLDWFGSPMIIGLAIIALVCFCYFLVWELTVSNPIVDLRLFQKRNFLAGTIAISIGYGVFFGNLVLLPQWMQKDLNYPVLYSGLVTAPLGIFAVICSPIIGRLLQKIDARLIVTAAFLLFSMVFYMRSLFTTDLDTWTLVLPTLLQGMPMAMFFIPLTVIILSGMPPEKIPAAAGLSNFVRVFFGAIGTSIGTTFWANRSILHHAQLTEEASAYSDGFASFTSQMSQQGIEPAVQNALFNRLVTVQSDMLGINDIFWISSLILLALIPLVWLSKPERISLSDEVSAGH